jgi:hypothetical protein
VAVIEVGIGVVDGINHVSDGGETVLTLVI